MKAASRLGLALVTAALALGPAAALAQEIPSATTNTTAPGAIGPRELQNFSLKGTVTQRSEPPAQEPAQTARPPRSQARPAPSTVQTRQSPSQRAGALISDQPVQTRTATAQAVAQPKAQAAQPPAQIPAAATANADAVPAPIASSPPAPSPAFAIDPALSPDTLAPDHKFPVLPWLLAALAVVAGAAFLFWRNRPREAFAGGPQVDAFTAPEPAPATPEVPAQPRPAPAPPKAAAPPPRSPGVVSTTLRPWMDIGFQPIRCILDDERLTVEFEIELFNSGSGPAREVLVEARLFNAGATQDQEIAAFFASPVGDGERIPVIPPLKRLGRKSQVVIARDQLQAYELAGRQVAVPLIAFNALYRWSGGEGQTSAGYLLGRDGKGEKLAPFRLDLGPRLFRGLAARPLPEAVRA